jgi:hypothetical protein
MEVWGTGSDDVGLIQSIRAPKHSHSVHSGCSVPRQQKAEGMTDVSTRPMALSFRSFRFIAKPMAPTCAGSSEHAPQSMFGLEN